MPTVLTTGGFDPIHPGHIAHIEEALKLGFLIVVLTRDDQLIEKDRLNGYVKKRLPIPYNVRKATLEWGLNGRGIVVENIDTDLTTRKSLMKYRPDIFVKGGDTWEIDNLPEKSICDDLGIKVVFGVGGFDKPYSSSKLGNGI
jgi:cytidyltransferase-like protein